MVEGGSVIDLSAAGGTFSDLAPRGQEHLLEVGQERQVFKGKSAPSLMHGGL